MDGIHPNAAGHRAYAAFLADNLRGLLMRDPSLRKWGTGSTEGGP